MLNLNGFFQDKSGDQGVFGRKVQELKKYYTDVTNALNESAIRFDLEISFDIPGGDFIHTMAGKIPGGFFNGTYERVFPEQVETALEVVSRLLKGNITNEHVVGLTQSGKNGTITSLQDFLGPIFLLSSQTAVQPIVWLPNNTGMENQSATKFQQSCELNGGIVIRNREKSITVQGYREHLYRNVVSTCAEIAQRECADTKAQQRIQVEVDQFFKNACCLRRTKSKDPVFKILVNACQKLNVLPAFLMDESHIAIGKNQASDNTLASPLNLPMDEEESLEDAREIYNTYRTLGKGDGFLVTVSATNQPFDVVAHRTNRQPVHLRLGRNYCGFAFMNGRPYPTNDHSVVEPKVVSLSQIAEQMGDKGVANLDLQSLTSLSNYLKAIVARDWQRVSEWLRQYRLDENPLKADGRNRMARTLSGSFNGHRSQVLAGTVLASIIGQHDAWEMYTLPKENQRKQEINHLFARYFREINQHHQEAKREAQKAFGRMWEWLLITNNPQKKKGGLVRWELRNEAFSNFIQPLNEIYKGRMIFKSYMDADAKKSPAELIRQQNPDGLPYVLVVTGLGRYGESYGREVGYAFDATNKNATVASFTQSLVGRMTGYGKYDPADPEGTRPLVILSNHAFQSVFVPWRENLGAHPRLKQHYQVTNESEVQNLRFIQLDRRYATSEVSDLLDKLGRFVPKMGGPKKARNTHENIAPIIETYLPHIERNLNILIPSLPTNARANVLRFGELDDQGIGFDWFGRRDEQPIGPQKFTLSTYKESRGSGGLLSTRNMNRRKGIRETERHWSVGIDYTRAEGVKRLVLVLAEPMRFENNPLDRMGLREGSVPDKLLRQSQEQAEERLDGDGEAS